MKDLVIIGAGGFGREVLQVALDCVEDGEPWNVLGFIDDGSPEGTELQGFPVIGGIDRVPELHSAHFVLAVGGPPTKLSIAQRLTAFGVSRFVSLIHPTAWVGRNVAIGEGSVLCAGVLATTDIEIGRHVILNLDCTVGHDARLGDLSTFAPSVNISGNVTTGEGVDVGTGGAIIHGVTIGEWSVVGAGAVVVGDLPPNTTAVGVPATVIKTRPVAWQRSN